MVTYAEWLEATEEAIGRDLTAEEEAEILAGLAADDLNNDGLVCMKEFYPSGNTPAFPAGFFNFKDNTAAVGT